MEMLRWVEDTGVEEEKLHKHQSQVKYRTRDKTARDGKDFVGGDFSLLFRHGETEKRVIIPIIDDMSAKGKEEYFEVCCVSVSLLES